VVKRIALNHAVFFKQRVFIDFLIRHFRLFNDQVDDLFFVDWGAELVVFLKLLIGFLGVFFVKIASFFFSLNLGPDIAKFCLRLRRRRDWPSSSLS